MDGVIGQQMRNTATQQAPSSDLACEVLHGTDPDVLCRIDEPGAAAVVWDRLLDPVLQDWLDTCPDDRLPVLRTTMHYDHAADVVAAACYDATGTTAPAHGKLAADIAMLAAWLAKASGTPEVKIRLDVVRGNACQRFHMDFVRMRLICTYRGCGTEYGIGQTGEIPDSVSRLKRGAASLFRGRRWPGEATGLVHRSPPIEGTGETRLLLVIDPHDPEDDED